MLRQLSKIELRDGVAHQRRLADECANGVAALERTGYDCGQLEQARQFALDLVGKVLNEFGPPATDQMQEG